MKYSFTLHGVLRTRDRAAAQVILETLMQYIAGNLEDDVIPGLEGEDIVMGDVTLARGQRDDDDDRYPRRRQQRSEPVARDAEPTAGGIDERPG
jgi:hypothetical protein